MVLFVNERDIIELCNSQLLEIGRVCLLYILGQ